MDYKQLVRQIEEQYQCYKKDGTWDQELLYQLLEEYLRRTIYVNMRAFAREDANLQKEIYHDIYIDIVSNAVNKYQDQGKSFAQYCGMIAKYKTIAAMKKLASIDQKEFHVDYTDTSEDGESAPAYTWMKELQTESAEESILEIGTMLELSEMLEYILHKIMNWEDKAYRTVACCYSIILYVLTHMEQKDNSSPRWAYEMICDYSVSERADYFLKELNRRLVNLKLTWGDCVLDSMETEEDGILICDMIYGKRFKVKDIENWTRRFQKKMVLDYCEWKDSPLTEG